MPEIEKKFKIDRIPENAFTNTLSIVQKYLLITDKFEFRIRTEQDISFDEISYLTIKDLNNTSRFENNIDIDKETANLLMTIPCPTIYKQRSFIRHKGKKYEFDEYDGVLKGLFVCEIEFDTQEEFDSFEIPDFLQELNPIDVTKNKDYKNRNLAKVIDFDAAQNLIVTNGSYVDPLIALIKSVTDNTKSNYSYIDEMLQCCNSPGTRQTLKIQRSILSRSLTTLSVIESGLSRK